MRRFAVASPTLLGSCPTFPTGPSIAEKKVSGVSESDLFFDTWAWWEYLSGTTVGHSLRDRFVEGGKYRIHTSAVSLGEIAAKLAANGNEERVDSACGAIRRLSHVWDVTADIAQEAGIAREELRRQESSASLADGIVLVSSRRAGARLVSGDSAFSNVPNLIDR